MMAAQMPKALSATDRPSSKYTHAEMCVGKSASSSDAHRIHAVALSRMRMRWLTKSGT